MILVLFLGWRLDVHLVLFGYVLQFLLTAESVHIVRALFLALRGGQLDRVSRVHGEPTVIALGEAALCLLLVGFVVSFWQETGKLLDVLRHVNCF